jgi:alpha-D-ribose 1-methylphosphonate 5-triphosphate synthase subunit PhnH
MNATLTPGFADPVLDAQLCFRAVLDAMARPGRIRTVQGVSAPPPLCDAAAAVLLTLADHETPLWLDPDSAHARAWIAFHTGAPLAPARQAMFALALSLPNPAEFHAGTDEMPETAATIILQVTSLTTGHRFLLEGPGLRDHAVLQVDGLPPDFCPIWQRNHALFPRGIDLILCSSNKLTALPRSVSVKDA